MLTSAYLVAHGMQILPGLEEPYAEGFRPLHVAMEDAGRRLRAEQVELLILLTPHGTLLPTAYGVYLNERLQGLYYRLTESNVFGDLRSRALWRGDREGAERLLAVLQGAGLGAEGLLTGSASYPAALAWGEVVPLHYLAGAAGPEVIVVSLPRSRADPVAIREELEGLGRALLAFASAEARRTSLVVSADLAHTHSAAGPYGAHQSAPAFDREAQAWACAPERGTLRRMLELQPTALACGMAGMCALQPVLEAGPFTCSGVTYAAPTYFGMMVAHWAPAQR